MGELYNISEARLILAINDMDIDRFKETYAEYKTGSLSEDVSDRVMELLNRIRLEGMENVPEDKRLQFLNQCIDLIELPAKKKKYFKLLSSFNSQGASLDEKDKLVTEMKAVCPEGREKELLMLELSLANTRLDFKKIKKVLESINALPREGATGQGG